MDFIWGRGLEVYIRNDLALKTKNKKIKEDFGKQKPEAAAMVMVACFAMFFQLGVEIVQLGPTTSTMTPRVILMDFVFLGKYPKLDIFFFTK